jgi:hypothetical protein
MKHLTYATHSFEFDSVDNVCSKKAIFVFNEVKKEKEKMSKVNGQYDINYYIKRKHKKIFQEQQKSSMDILSFNRKKKKKMKVHDYRILHIQ